MESMPYQGIVTTIPLVCVTRLTFEPSDEDYPDCVEGQRGEFELMWSHCESGLFYSFEVPSHGHKLVCYFSAGSYENWRADAKAFPSSALGNKLEGWEGEKWLDIRSSAVKTIMEARLTKAASRGCDAVEPDNVDGYQNKNGVGLTSSNQKDYNIWLAKTAHSKGLSVGLKNAVDLIKDLEPYFDWALNEECVNYGECGKYKPFLDKHKPVFHVEYVDNHSEGTNKAKKICSSHGRPHQFNTLIKDWDLTSWRIAC